MTWRKVLQDWRTGVWTMVVAIAVSFAAQGWQGAVGMALGLVATIVQIGGLWGVIWLLGKSAADEPAPRSASALIILTFLMKLPVFIVLSSAAKAIGLGSPGCFLWGLGLVYCALIGWALAKG